MFGHKVGEKLKKSIGFQYRIFRMEETLDMRSPLVAQDEQGKLNNVVQFKPSTLQAMLALPVGDEEAFIEAQVQAGNPVENQSARQVQESVKKWKEAKSKEVSETVSNEFNLFADEYEVADRIQSVDESEENIVIESESTPTQNPELTSPPTEQREDEVAPLIRFNLSLTKKIFASNWKRNVRKRKNYQTKSLC